MNKGVIIGIVIAVLVVAGIGGGLYVAGRSKIAPGPAITSPSTSAAPDQNSIAEPTTAPADEVSGPVKEFTVTGSSFKFSPSTITVKKGDTVRVTFKDSGGPLHNFKIDEFDVATSQLGDEETEEVEFVADKSGTFEYYCSVGNHRAMGMVGKLVVQ